jgi:cell division protein FtsI (penicillin-binding protein 3)
MSVKKEIIVRFGFIYALAVLVMIPILFSAGTTIIGEGDFWRAQGAKSKRDSLIVKPNRGNILACDGKLLASSIPSYKLYMDFFADGFQEDTLYKYIDTLSRCLAGVCKGKTPQEIKRRILDGYKEVHIRYERTGKKNRWYPLNLGNMSYTELKEIKQFPFFDSGTNASGLGVHEQVRRKKPFGSLASRTIGGLYAETDKGGSSGIEMKYDSLLKGKSGISSRQKIAGRFRTVNEVDPVDGLDIQTTIDINIQDITESALLKKLMEVDAEKGCAVVMEVQTGEIKAISNLERRAGVYEETQNFAVSSETEPGSTFKVASVIAALEDGVVDTSYRIDTGKGIYYFGRTPMKDHNYHKEGYGEISLAQSIWHSSNIGVSRMIYEFYKDQPERFVNRLYTMKLNEPIDLEIPGSGRPKIKHPDDMAVNWSGTTLPWMSIGYETQIPPIYMLTFYNGIANNGRVIKPFFVKAICKDGNEIKKFSTEVINPSLCSQRTLGKVRQMLVDVVEKGTATAVKSKDFQIAGKTGTAQVDYGRRGKTKTHQLTFCGFFPAENPQYTCIVVVWSPNRGYPSAGGISGVVFKDIAERIYAQSPLLRKEPDVATEESSAVPYTKDGNLKELKIVLEKLDIPYTIEEQKNVDWVYTEAHDENISIREHKIHNNLVPKVVGMGAKDAIFLLENKGLQVRISGRGRVSKQSISPGQNIRNGDIIHLELR